MARPLNIDAAALDRAYVLHPFTNLEDHARAGGPMMVKGKGITLTDTEGRSYLDAMAGLWCVNVGYGRAEIADAIRDQAVTLPYYHGFSSMSTDTPAILAARIVEAAPEGMARVFFGSSGSDANDTQVKLVWYYNAARGKPGKRKIIARNRGYHGVTLAAASLTGLEGLHKGFGIPLDFARHVRAPYRLWEAEPGASDADFVARLARELEDMILAEGPDTVGAFIAEPIQGAGGVIVPPAGYFPAIQEVLRRHDVLLIVDEVICGFGRLGTMFGSEVYGIEPDLMTIAKGVTSAYVPLSGCVVSQKVYEVIAGAGRTHGPFGHGYTYTAHPLAAAAALANLDIIENENLIGAARERGAEMRAALADAFGDHPLVGEVRGEGLVAAVELVARREPATRFDPALKVAPRVIKAALKRGLISRALPSSDTLAFSPPFVVTSAEIAEIVGRAREALDEVVDELSAEGALARAS
ncbi:aminotransferase [Salinarimonas sp. NSM]|uniref:aminotransferase n=1 Tax=Salinarimonas sp. NSM TaxID=3458003 RepID=UPI004035D6A0